MGSVRAATSITLNMMMPEKRRQARKAEQEEEKRLERIKRAEERYAAQKEAYGAEIKEIMEQVRVEDQGTGWGAGTSQVRLDLALLYDARLLHHSLRLGASALWVVWGNKPLPSWSASLRYAAYSDWGSEVAKEQELLTWHWRSHWARYKVVQVE